MLTSLLPSTSSSTQRSASPISISRSSPSIPMSVTIAVPFHRGGPTRRSGLSRGTQSMTLLVIAPPHGLDKLIGKERLVGNGNHHSVVRHMDV